MTSEFQGKIFIPGYNHLHLAVIKSDLNLAKKLLKLGANILQQGAQDGKTPLHKAIDNVTNFFQLSIWELMGILKQNQWVNILLSAQVQNNNPLNVKCKNGISHLHIACMFNHAEAVMFLAKNKESVNERINSDSNVLPGYTPLHCAIRYGSLEAAAILLTLGADIYLKNADGVNSVCYLVDRLLNVNDNFRSTNRVKYYSHCYDPNEWSSDIKIFSERFALETEIENLISLMKTIVFKNRFDDAKLVENTGFSAFHLACMLKDDWIMETFLTWDFEDINEPVTFNSKFWLGWTPLHFAACFNIQIFGKLLRNKADIRIKNLNGQTALDLCLQRHTPQMVLSYLQTDITMSDKFTKLSNLMLAISGNNGSYKFLRNLRDINQCVPFESRFWPGYNLLHMMIAVNRRLKSTNFRNGNKCSLNADYSVTLHRNDEPSYFEEGMAYWKNLETLLIKDCSIYAKNADGLTPIHLAFERDDWHVLEELLACARKDVVGPDNLSFLHIACAMGKIDVVEQLLKTGANVNSPVTSSLERYAKPQKISEMGYQSALRKVLIRKNSTPLHIAVIFKMEKVVEKLLKRHANVFAPDELGLTPLHLSMVSTKKIAQTLVAGTIYWIDITRQDGLSYMHVAAFADDDKAVKKLRRCGSNVNGAIKKSVPKLFTALVGKTPLHLAMGGEKAASVLFENGADILAENPYKLFETPLDLVMRQFDMGKCKFPIEKLKAREFKIDALTASGLTTLHIACANLDFDWAKSLLKRGADPNAQINYGEKRINTPMRLMISSASFSQRMPEVFILFVKRLVEYRADLNISNNNRTPLHLMANIYFDDKIWKGSSIDKAALLAMIDWLLSNLKQYNINYTDLTGFSYFHLACISNNVVVLKKYLDNGIDINHSTCLFTDKSGGFTPLHFAITYKNMDVVELLLAREADVRFEDTNGNTPLHLAIKLRFGSFQLFSTLLKKGANINAKNLSNETPLVCQLSHGNMSYTDFQFFILRGSIIDIRETVQGYYENKGIMGFILENIRSVDVILVIKSLIKDPNIKNGINNGYLAIHSLVSARPKPYVTREHYFKLIQGLVGAGSDIDEEDKYGKRPLDKAVAFENNTAVETLLLLGANVNVIEDNEGYSSIVPSSSCPAYLEVPKECMKMHLWKMAVVNLDLSTSFKKL